MPNPVAPQPAPQPEREIEYAQALPQRKPEFIDVLFASPVQRRAVETIACSEGAVPVDFEGNTLTFVYSSDPAVKLPDPAAVQNHVVAALGTEISIHLVVAARHQVERALRDWFMFGLFTLPDADTRPEGLGDTAALRQPPTLPRLA